MDGVFRECFTFLEGKWRRWRVGNAFLLNRINIGEWKLANEDTRDFVKLTSFIVYSWDVLSGNFERKNFAIELIFL